MVVAAFPGNTHGLPPEDPGTEEDSPGALRWDLVSYATWWGDTGKKHWGQSELQIIIPSGSSKNSSF